MRAAASLRARPDSVACSRARARASAIAGFSTTVGARCTSVEAQPASAASSKGIARRLMTTARRSFGNRLGFYPRRQ